MEAATAMRVGEADAHTVIGLPSIHPIATGLHGWKVCDHPTVSLWGGAAQPIVEVNGREITISIGNSSVRAEIVKERSQAVVAMVNVDTPSMGCGTALVRALASWCVQNGIGYLTGIDVSPNRESTKIRMKTPGRTMTLRRRQEGESAADTAFPNAPEALKLVLRGYTHDKNGEVLVTELPLKDGTLRLGGRRHTQETAKVAEAPGVKAAKPVGLDTSLSVPDPTRMGVGIPPAPGLRAAAHALQETFRAEAPSAVGAFLPVASGATAVPGYDQPAVDLGIEKEPGGQSFHGLTRSEWLGEGYVSKYPVTLRPSADKSLKTVAPEAFLNGRFLAKYGPKNAAVFDGKKVIASYDFGNVLLVAPGFRGQGIATELVYQWRIRFPGPGRAQTRTPASQHIQEKVWERIMSEQHASEIASRLCKDYQNRHGVTPRQINQGLCVEFAEDLVFAMKEAGLPAEQAHRDWLEPELRGMSEDEANDLEIEDAHILPHHSWVQCNGRHYDSEAIGGVDSWANLPIYSRFLAENPDARASLGMS